MYEENIKYYGSWKDASRAINRHPNSVWAAFKDNERINAAMFLSLSKYLNFTFSVEPKIPGNNPKQANVLNKAVNLGYREFITAIHDCVIFNAQIAIFARQHGLPEGSLYNLFDETRTSFLNLVLQVLSALGFDLVLHEHIPNETEMLNNALKRPYNELFKVLKIIIKSKYPFSEFYKECGITKSTFFRSFGKDYKVSLDVLIKILNKLDLNIHIGVKNE